MSNHNLRLHLIPSDVSTKTIEKAYSSSSRGKMMRFHYMDLKVLNEAKGRVLTGNSCEYIYLCNITENSGCEDGSKFVIKQADNTR